MSNPTFADYNSVRTRDLSWLDISGNPPTKNSLLSIGLIPYLPDRAKWVSDISINTLRLSGGGELTCSGDTLLVNGVPVGGGGGSTGVLGVSGSTGLLGVSGSVGFSPIGASGAIGVSGEEGVPNSSTITGVNGITGVQGLSGIAGLPGGFGFGPPIYGEETQQSIANTTLTFTPTLGPTGTYFMTVAIDICNNYGFTIPAPTPPASSSITTFTVAFFNLTTLAIESPFSTNYYNTSVSDNPNNFGAVSTSFFCNETPIIVTSIGTVVAYPIGNEPLIRMRYKYVRIA